MAYGRKKANDLVRKFLGRGELLRKTDRRPEPENKKSLALMKSRYGGRFYNKGRHTEAREERDEENDGVSPVEVIFMDIEGESFASGKADGGGESKRKKKRSSCV